MENWNYRSSLVCLCCLSAQGNCVCPLIIVFHSTWRMRNDALSTQFVCLTMTKQITLDLTDCWLRLFWYFNLFHYSKLARLSLQWDLSWSPSPNSKQSRTKETTTLRQIKTQNTQQQDKHNIAHTHKQEEHTHRKRNKHTGRAAHAHWQRDTHTEGAVWMMRPNQNQKRSSKCRHTGCISKGAGASEGGGNRGSIAISKERQSKRADFLGALRL